MTAADNEFIAGGMWLNGASPSKSSNIYVPGAEGFGREAGIIPAPCFCVKGSARSLASASLGREKASGFIYFLSPQSVTINLVMFSII